MATIDNAILSQAACEACLLLNEAVRELLTPRRVHALTENVPEGPVNMQALGALRHIALTSVVIHLWRLHEVWTNFLVPWLFTDEELARLGLPSVESFLGGAERLKHLEIVRHQYAGHPTAKRAEGGRPGTIIRPEVLGRAIRETGLRDSKAFLERVERELVPGVEAVVRELVRRYPAAETYLKETYPLGVEGGLHGG